jgi:hypothetical protein
MTWKLRSLAIVIALLAISTSAALAQTPTLAADKDDYMPGETVTLTGAGWMPGETVAMVIHEDPATHEDRTLTSVADSAGAFTNSDFAPEAHDVGVGFTVFATGAASGWTAQALFADGGPPKNPVPQPLPYFENFDGLDWSSGCPNNVDCSTEFWPRGWEGWRINAPGGPQLTFANDGPVLDENLRAFGAASNNAGGVYNYLGKIGFLTSNATNTCLVLALNTVGREGVKLSFTLMVIRNPYIGDCLNAAVAGIRTNLVDVQYRIGESGLWTSLSGNPNGIYQASPTFKVGAGDTSPWMPQGVGFLLPTACWNQPEVQVRWVQRDVDGECGPRPSFAIDNVSVGGSPLTCLSDVTPPTIECPRPIAQTVDPGRCTARVTFSVSATDNCSSRVNIDSTPRSGSDFPIGTTTVTSVATDDAGNRASCRFDVTVTNPAPRVALTAPASGTVVAINTPVALAGTADDNAGDVHSGSWSFDGVPGSDAVNVLGDGAPTVTLVSTHTFTAPGVYLARLTVSDQCGGTGSSNSVGGMDALIVVFDPNAGFVTGGGWINSPPGAYVPDPSLADRANFGFVSKYKKGASTPTGETEFQFRVAGLDFHASVYEWLVIAGAKAQYKGSGTINGAGDYGFMLTATDGMFNGGPDRLRMKIIDRSTSAVVYDNQTGAGDNSDPTTAIAGGSIVVHAGPVGSGGASITSLQPHGAAIPSVYALAPAMPNPFTSATSLSFSLPKAGSVTLRIYDVSGREVVRLVDEDMPAGEHMTGWSGRDRDGHAAPGGIYFVRISARSLDGAAPYQETRRIALMR